jgi:hypothetical protein
MTRVQAYWSSVSRSQRMTNAKLKAASPWTPRWRSAREGLHAAIQALGEEIRSVGSYRQGVSV